jgi:cytochrome c553
MKHMHNTRRFALLLPILGAFVAAYLPGMAGAADNSDVGARIVADGTAKGAIACARCHGFDGASDGSGAFPALVGQPAHYLANQLKHFASGERQNAIMESIAKGLTPDEMESVAQYYASVRASVIPPRAASSELLARGAQVALVGDRDARVQACVSCHGPNGAGEPPTVPYLAGQYRQYVKVQIQMFQRGYRKSAQMTNVAHDLTEKDTEAVATYFDQLPRPTPPPK